MGDRLEAADAEKAPALYGIERRGGRPNPNRVRFLAITVTIALLIIPTSIALSTRSANSIATLVGLGVLCVGAWLSFHRSLESVTVHKGGDGRSWLSGESVTGAVLTAPLADIERITRGNRYSLRRVHLRGQRRLGFSVGRNDLALFLERLAVDLDPDVDVELLRWSSFLPRHSHFFDHTSRRSHGRR